MPDEPLTNDTEATQGQAADATEQPVAEAATSTAPTDDSAFWDRVSALDPDELVRKHQRLGGKVGDLADKLAARKAKDILDAQDAKRKQDELDRLLNEDPDRYVETVRQDKAKGAEISLMEAEVYAEVGAIYEELPQAAKEKLAGKNYPRGAKGIKAYVQDLANTLVETQIGEAVTKAGEKEYKRGLEAGRKAALAEINGDEPTPDIETAGSSVSRFRMPSLQQLDDMSIEDFKKNQANILAALPDRIGANRRR